MLEDPNEDIKNNSTLALRILSDLPDAFLKIVDIIHDKLTLLDKVNTLNNLIINFYLQIKGIWT